MIVINILVIGNGFDIAHGLPTKYIDFLKFIRLINDVYNKTVSDVNKPTKEYLLEVLLETDKKHNNCECDYVLSPKLLKVLKNKSLKELNDDIYKIYSLTNTNFWIKYFNIKLIELGDNWIDFEAEISKVIEKLDCKNWHENLQELNNQLPIEDCLISNKHLLDDFIKLEKIEKTKLHLENNLNDLIEALDIYFHNYINLIPIQKTTKKNIDQSKIQQLSIISELKINKVLSFNYTNTYERAYKNKKTKIEYHYIHGKAQKHENEKSNIVLGINEYLDLDERNKNIDFIKFKKYFQRLHKNTGGTYKIWLDTIKEQQLIYTYKLNGYRFIKIAIWFSKTFEKWFNKSTPHIYYHKVYFFGHSLDVVDKDIIETLILNDNVRSYIYYHDHEAFADKISNLVKIIGEEELIKRTSGKHQTIFFISQKSSD